MEAGGAVAPLPAQPLSRRAESVDRLQIERIGGLAGFGGPHLKSRGEVALSDLAPADRQAVEDLVSYPRKAVPAQPAGTDAVGYHITRQTAAGAHAVGV